LAPCSVVTTAFTMISSKEVEAFVQYAYRA
jgi:hypothetical protein